MEIILAIVIGVLGGSGVWLVLRARSYQVLMGLSLLSYAVNLFIFSMGSLFIDREPIVRAGLEASLEHYTDPLPQSLVLTAIVIGFATSALFLVVLLALRGLSGTDHVDGAEPALLAPEANAGPASAFFQTHMPDTDSTLGKEEGAAAPAPAPQAGEAGKAEENAAAPSIVLAAEVTPSIVLVAEAAPIVLAAEAAPPPEGKAP
ncbi:MAG: Na+/H+ antiporter subunit C [Ottowia sp.]|nr:Na+/H+ antiporter subunit C [Ottowia sp.]